LSSATGVNPSGVSKLASVFDTTTVILGPVDITGGLRYDYFTVDGKASALAGNPLGLPVGTFDVNVAQGRLNPSFKVALNAIDWFQPYVSYAETFRPPTSNELMVGGDHPSGGTAAQFIPNPNLKPEVAKTWEVGVNIVRDGIVTADDSLRIKADVFVSRIDNYITAQLTPASAAYFANNPGTSTVTGFELQGGYDAGAFFASLAYTHTSTDLPAQINGFGAQSYLPDDIFTTTFGTRLLDDHSLTLGGRLYAVSQSYVGTVNVSAGQSAYQPGYQLVDLFANYKLENGLELGANISNVFNVAYTPALSTTPTTQGVTGRGRTVELTAKARF
jgi:hemoglobin/transferrin/lactoferrin receptor protein